MSALPQSDGSNRDRADQFDTYIPYTTDAPYIYTQVVQPVLIYIVVFSSTPLLDISVTLLEAVPSDTPALDPSCCTMSILTLRP